MQLFSVLYIHTDKPSQSDILGIFKTKEEAVAELLERANFRERNGQLTQYLQPTTEYDSFDQLKKLVTESNELTDVDIYKIVPVFLQE